MEGLDDLICRGPLFGCVGEQFQQRGFVSNERADPTGMTSDQGQSGDRAAAAAEHVCAIGSHRIHDRGDIVGSELGSRVLLGIVEPALRDAARIKGDDGAISGQSVRERAEVRRRHRCAHDQQERARPADFVVQVRAGDVEVVGCAHGRWPFVECLPRSTVRKGRLEPDREVIGRAGETCSPAVAGPG